MVLCAFLHDLRLPRGFPQILRVFQLTCFVCIWFSALLPALLHAHHHDPWILMILQRQRLHRDPRCLALRKAGKFEQR